MTGRPELQKAYGSAWDEIAAGYRELPAYAKRTAFSTLIYSRLGQIAQQLVTYSEEIGKPNDVRYDEFRDSKLEGLKFGLSSAAPIYPDMEEAILASWLAEAKTLGKDDPFVRAALQGSTPAAVAKSVIAQTKLGDVTARKALFEGGAGAISTSDDPLIVLPPRGAGDPRAALVERTEDSEPRMRCRTEDCGSAVRGVDGKNLSPDANANLRISYGKVMGYEEDTTLVPYKTTFNGLSNDRAAGFDEKTPFELPQRWRDGKSKLELSTPMNLVYTADTIGGNSGSPVISVTLKWSPNFDSNLQKLPNRYWYIDDEEGSRAVGIHSSAIIEALRKLYGAERLRRRRSRGGDGLSERRALATEPVLRAGAKVGKCVGRVLAPPSARQHFVGLTWAAFTGTAGALARTGC